jgi:hypothetical protein
MKCSFCMTREGTQVLRLRGSQQVWNLCSDTSCAEEGKRELTLRRQLMNSRCYWCGVVIRKSPHKEKCEALVRSTQR